MFMTCSIDTNKSLHEIAYGESFSQDNSQEANLPSPINEIAHLMIKSHQDQLTFCKLTIEQIASMNPEDLNLLLSPSSPLRIVTLVAISILPLIALTAIALSIKILADRHTPIKDRLPELQTDFPGLYARLMR